VIIKLCDTGDFYDHIPYSSACGWSVNLNGTEGFNTCYDYDDNGFAVGFAYKLRLRMGEVISADASQVALAMRMVR